MRRVVYVDMDNVLVDFGSAVGHLSSEIIRRYDQRLFDVPGIFALMQPMPAAVESFHELCALFDTYILSAAPWTNPSSWTDKLTWVQRFLGDAAKERLIISHHKDLNRGDFIIDDRTDHGVGAFAGEHIHFGAVPFPDWPAVVHYLRPRA